MDNFKINKFGRSYISGKPLSDDLRILILDTIQREGGDRTTGYCPVSYAKIAERFSVSQQTIAKIWRTFCQKNTFAAESCGGLRTRKLTDNDLELIETLKSARGSISIREICEILQEFGDVQGEIAMSTISRVIKSRLLSGKKYSRKKITHVALQRFTFTNILYTQLFINYLSSKDARKIKFFDEAGIKSPDAGVRFYGHAPVGERCVEVIRKHEDLNTTLNLLVSLNGVEYYNLIDGATDTVQFLNFLEEAANTVGFETGRPVLEVDDIIVMDNLAVHHYEGGEVLEEYLADMGIELLYTPVYSPDLNPVELCFNKIKTQLNHRFQEVFKVNLNLACALALETITHSDMMNFYKLTSYLFEL